MKTLTTWNPFRGLGEFQNRLSPFFSGFNNGFPNSGVVFTFASWSPDVDITENDKEYLVEADLPEMKKEDVKVVLDRGILSISGERKSEKEEKGRKYHRIERSCGTFERTFKMPEDADSAKMKAEFADGVLHVHMPKNPTAQRKKIEMKMSNEHAQRVLGVRCAFPEKAI